MRPRLRSRRRSGRDARRPRRQSPRARRPPARPPRSHLSEGPGRKPGALSRPVGSTVHGARLDNAARDILLPVNSNALGEVEIVPTDLTVVLVNRPGSDAAAMQALGRAGINIDGITGSGCASEGILHILVADGAAAPPGPP